MGTKEYLDGLSLDQLYYAKSCVDSLIREKTSGDRVTLWCVETCNFTRFFESYNEAKKVFLDEANSISNESKKEFECGITSTIVYRDQVENYVSR